MEENRHKADTDESKQSQETYWKRHGRGIGCLVLYIIGLLIFSMVFIPSLLCMRRPAWQSRAKGTLRSIGSSQLAYQGANSDRNYGTFEELKRDMYIAEGYTLGNMIENYSMTWEAYNLSTSPVEPAIHRFTVIAYPSDPRRLPTFCVTEDQVVREYVPETGNEFEDVYNWDPIL